MKTVFFKKPAYQLIIATVILFFASSCGEENKEKKLQKLRQKQEQIADQIRELEDQLEKEGIDVDSLYMANGGKRQVYVKIKQIIPEKFKHFIEVQGNIESDNNIFIPPQSSGVVKKIHVEKGDKVEKGALLASLDDAIYQRNIAQIKTNLELAKTMYDRQKKLWEQKIGSEVQYLQAKNTKENLEKQLDVVQEQLEMTRITSPIDGTVDEITIKEGEFASAGFGAIRVVQLSKLKIKASLSESYITSIEEGDSVKVFIPATGKETYLNVDAVSQAIDPANRTFEVEIDLPASFNHVKPNMLAVLTINDYTNEDALVVPVNSVQTTGSENFVFTVQKAEKGWKVKKRFIQKGKYYIDKVEIKDGLKPGEQVVVFGYQDLSDGQLVEIQ